MASKRKLEGIESRATKRHKPNTKGQGTIFNPIQSTNSNKSKLTLKLSKKSKNESSSTFSHRSNKPSSHLSSIPDLNHNPLNREKREREREKEKEIEIEDYPIYRQKEEISRCEDQIKLIDKYLASIKTDKISGCPKYENCQKRLCEPNDNKLRELALELIETEKYINNKYECKEQIIQNEYNELQDRAKQRLIAKYMDKKSKQERMFKSEFGRHQRKIEKAQKKLAKQQKEEKEQKEEKKGDEDKDGPTCLEEILFKKDRYRRATLINSNNSLSTKVSGVKFNDITMQNKWIGVHGIADRDMEADVNTMVADQDQGNGSGGLEIKDILSMFPKCDVSYKSDKNILQIGNEHEINITLKVGSYIASKYKGQSIMFGTVKSIGSKDVWCWLRQKGDKFANFALHRIPITNIEEGKVKIKLIH